MFPDLLAAHCAFSSGGKIEFPTTHPAAYLVWNEPCLRVILRGGHFYDLPDHARLRPSPSAIPEPILSQTTGNLLPAPCYLPPAQLSVVPYNYVAQDNRGNSHRYVGDVTVLPSQAELLGWLTGAGTLHSENQSIRFASGDQAALHRVKMLCTKSFPGVGVNWYPKLSGYDLTFTAGINNPLKHFLRQMDFQHGCPMAVGRHFSECGIQAFLQGLWGADGWLYTRKGGQDVIFGLSRSPNEYLFSWLRLLHAGLGLQGARETDKHGSSRLVFNGYVNYARFMSKIGQIGSRKLPSVPIRRTAPTPPTYLANGGEMWYDAPVAKVLRLGKALPIYRVDLCLKPSNTKPTKAAAPKM